MTRTRRSRWRLNRPWPVVSCLRPPGAGCSRSTRCRVRATGTGTRWPAQVRAGDALVWPPFAHRHGRAPAAARRLRAGPSDRGASPPNGIAVWARTDAHKSCARCCASSTTTILEAFASKRGGCSAARPAPCWRRPTPRAAARLTLSQLRRCCAAPGCNAASTPKPHDSRRYCAATTCTHPSLVEEAFGQQALALLRQLDPACANAEDLADAATERFARHPDGHHHQHARPRRADRRPRPGRDRRRP